MLVFTDIIAVYIHILRICKTKGMIFMGISANAPWRAFYGNTPATIDYPRKTMQQLVCETARKYPNNIAYTFMGKDTTYASFAKRIEAAAKGLYHMGIRKGDRVTICMPNSPQALDCFYGLKMTLWQ